MRGKGDPEYRDSPLMNAPTEQEIVEFNINTPTLDFTKPLPFKIRLTDRSGKSCNSVCADKHCQGCELVPTTDVVPFLAKSNGHTLTVHWEKWVQQSCYDISASMTVKGSLSYQECKKLRNTEAKIDIHSCFKLFSSFEKLGPNDEWYCKNCLQHKQAFKKLEIFPLPKILIIQIKRFQFTRFSGGREKINTEVLFPLENLDISQHIQNEYQQGAKYNLFGVSNHSGSLGGGHYTAYCKNRLNGNWYHCNDSSVTQLKSLDSIHSSAAYLLFYELVEEPKYIKRQQNVF